MLLRGRALPLLARGPVYALRLLQRRVVLLSRVRLLQRLPRQGHVGGVAGDVFARGRLQGHQGDEPGAGGRIRGGVPLLGLLGAVVSTSCASTSCALTSAHDSRILESASKLVDDFRYAPHWHA